jgi:hypothetical protein
MKKIILCISLIVLVCISCTQKDEGKLKQQEKNVIPFKDILVGNISDSIINSSISNKLKDTLNVKYLILLLDSINNEDFIELHLNALNYYEKYTGGYYSDEKVGQYSKNWMDVTKLAHIVSFHTADSILWQHFREELKIYKKQEKFKEGSFTGTRYIGEIYTFESLRPINGINLSDHTAFEIYIFKTKR